MGEEAEKLGQGLSPTVHRNTAGDTELDEAP